MSNSSLAIVKQFYELLATGRAAEALALLHDQVEWTEAERTPYFCGPMRGMEAVQVGLFQALQRDFSAFACTPHDFIAEGSRIAAFGNYSGLSRKGGALSAPFVHLWTVKEERLKRFFQYTDSAAWADALATSNLR
jgi:ketosteroid isomerase-like protein